MNDKELDALLALCEAAPNGISVIPDSLVGVSWETDRFYNAVHTALPDLIVQIRTLTAKLNEAQTRAENELKLKEQFIARWRIQHEERARAEAELAEIKRSQG